MEHEGIVGILLRRHFIAIDATILVRLEHLPLPIIYGIRRISHDDVEGLKRTIWIEELGVRERIATLDVCAIESMEEHIDLRDGVGADVEFLAIEIESASNRFALLLFQVVERLEEEATGADRRVVDVILLVRFENLDDHALHFARRIEFASLLARIRSKLLDEIFVGITEEIGVDVGVAEVVLREVVDEALKRLVREAVLIGEIEIIENLIEFRAIGIREFVEHLVQLHTDALGAFLDDRPATILWDLEAVVIVGTRDRLIVELAHHALVLLVPHVANALEEEKAEDVFLVVRTVDLTPEDVGALPEELLELWERELAAHLVDDRLDVLRAILPVAALPSAHGHEDAFLFPVTEGVLVNVENLGHLADGQKIRQPFEFRFDVFTHMLKDYPIACFIQNQTFIGYHRFIT